MQYGIAGRDESNHGRLESPNRICGGSVVSAPNCGAVDSAGAGAVAGLFGVNVSTVSITQNGTGSTAAQFLLMSVTSVHVHDVAGPGRRPVQPTGSIEF
jgi:hypothetical protein